MDLTNIYNANESYMTSNPLYAKEGKTEEHAFKHYVFTLGEVKRLLKSGNSLSKVIQVQVSDTTMLKRKLVSNTKKTNGTNKIAEFILVLHSPFITTIPGVIAACSTTRICDISTAAITYLCDA